MVVIRRLCVSALLVVGLVLGLGGNALGGSGAQSRIATVPTSKLGDRDNFGYGRGTGPPPCAFFDNREPEDLGVFDYELTSGDEVNTWTHTFPVTGTPKRVTLTTWEIFSDVAASTISLDGHVFPYSPGGGDCFSYPEGGVERVHELIGPDAAVAADGEIVVTFSENGDDIAIDRATLKVRFG